MKFDFRLKGKRSVALNGFTLIEIIVVLTLIAILAVLIIQSFTNQANKANDSRRKADLQRIATAFEEYYSDESHYPPVPTDCGGNELQPYLDVFPCDPVSHKPYCYLPIAPSPGKPTYFQQYRLLTTLKNLSDPIIKSLGCDSALFCGWETECSYTGSSGFNYGVSSLNAALSNPNVIVIPPATPTPTPGPTGQGGSIYACAYDAGPPPHANCNSYPSAKDKGCVTFSDPVVCQQACDQSRSNWCY